MVTLRVRPACVIAPWPTAHRRAARSPRFASGLRIRRTLPRCTSTSRLGAAAGDVRIRVSVADRRTPQPGVTRPGGPDLTARERRLVRLGVGGALVMYAALAVLQVFAVAPFLTQDESAHVDYAVRVAEGHLPEAGTQEGPRYLSGQPRTGQYVANHPPLYHAVSGVILRLGMDDHDRDTGFYAARLLTAAFTLVTIVLVAALSLMVGGRRRAVLAVGAAALTAVFSPLTFASATIQNDSLAAMFATAALVALVRIVLRGSDRWSLAALCGCCALGALTRATMLPIVAVVALALVAAAVIRPDGRPLGGRLATGFAQAGLVVGTTLLVAGWFYVLNIDRYGDAIGGSVVYANVVDRAGEPSSGSILHFLADPGSWAQLWRQSFGGLPSRNQSSARSSAWIASLAGVLVAAGAITACVRSARARRASSPGPRQSPAPRRPLMLARLSVAGALVACIAEISVHVTNGGAPHGRYLSPGIAALAIGVAAALLALPLLRGLAAFFTVLGAQVWASLAFEAGILRRVASLAHATSFDLFSRSLTHNGVPFAPGLLVALLGVACFGLATVLAAQWILAEVERRGPKARAPAQLVTVAAPAEVMSH